MDELLDRAAAMAGGAIDILVNNAGTTDIAPFRQQSVDGIVRQVQVNLAATMALTRHALPGMLERKRGHLVFMSSLQAAVPTPAFAVYGAACTGRACGARSAPLRSQSRTQSANGRRAL